MSSAEQAATGEWPSISVVIPVGGNRTGALERIRGCVESVLAQDYPGRLEAILVVDAGSPLADLRFSRPVRIVEYVRPASLEGRDARFRWAAGWRAADTELLASTGTSLVWAPDVARTAVERMRAAEAEAIDGIVRRRPDDRRFVSAFRDEALVTEFPRYGGDGFLSTETFATARRLPTFASFFMTRDYFLRALPAIPSARSDGWEDFGLARAMVEAAGPIWCTDDLVAHADLGGSFRFGKQFTSGIACVQFARLDPANGYARRRLRRAYQAALGAVGTGYLASLFVAFEGLAALALLGLLGAVAIAVLAVVNVARTHDPRALLFPPITLLQILLWVAGALYAQITEETERKELVAWAHRLR